MFRAIHPIMGTRNLEGALRFYIDLLGFTLAFRDPTAPGNYAGIRRDNIELYFNFSTNTK